MLREILLTGSYETVFFIFQAPWCKNLGYRPTSLNKPTIASFVVNSSLTFGCDIYCCCFFSEQFLLFVQLYYNFSSVLKKNISSNKMRNVSVLKYY